MDLRIAESLNEHNLRDFPRRLLKKAVQQGRREWATEAYPEGTSQGDTGPRTPLADFFSILLGLPQSYWPVGLAGLLELLHMTSKGWAELGGEDCFSVGRDVLLDLLDRFCQLFNQSLA